MSSLRALDAKLITPPPPLPCALGTQIGFTEEDYIGLFDETPIPRQKKETTAAGAMTDKKD